MTPDTEEYEDEGRQVEFAGRLVQVPGGVGLGPQYGVDPFGGERGDQAVVQDTGGAACPLRRPSPHHTRHEAASQRLKQQRLGVETQVNTRSKSRPVVALRWLRSVGALRRTASTEPASRAVPRLVGTGSGPYGRTGRGPHPPVRLP